MGGDIPMSPFGPVWPTFLWSCRPSWFRTIGGTMPSATWWSRSARRVPIWGFFAADASGLCPGIMKHKPIDTPENQHVDTQNDGLEKVFGIYVWGVPSDIPGLFSYKPMNKDPGSWTNQDFIVVHVIVFCSHGIQLLENWWFGIRIGIPP